MAPLTSLFTARHIDPDILERELKVGRPLLPLSAQERPYQAMLLADEDRQDNIERGVSFGFETVFPDAEGHKIAFLQRAIALGYTVVLLFIGVESPDISARRVAARVAMGGHDVPTHKIQAPRRAISQVTGVCVLESRSAPAPAMLWLV